MLPTLRKFLRSILYDEQAFIGWARGLILAIAAGGLAFAHELGDLLASPVLEQRIKVAAVLCGFVGGMIRAGDKTPANVRALANNIAPETTASAPPAAP